MIPQMEYLYPALKALALVPATLLPIINPLSTAPVFASTTGGDRLVSKRLARQVALNSWFVMVAAMLIGTYVLDFFGISLPIVRIGGGLLVASTGWRMLHTSESDEVQTAASAQTGRLSDAEIMKRSFFPITFPLTTGPGTIAASITLGAKLPDTPALYVVGAAVAAVGAALTSLVLYFTFKHAAALLEKLGEVGTLVMMRLLAFILLCVGVEFIWTGWADLNHL
ncbi:MAG TPA: MarC family protein [Steroidobacteraceae bacterium]|nr:MarC family protein [Steroidobacteraceae bacterium]